VVDEMDIAVCGGKHQRVLSVKFGTSRTGPLAIIRKNGKLARPERMEKQGGQVRAAGRENLHAAVALPARRRSLHTANCCSDSPNSARV